MGLGRNNGPKKKHIIADLKTTNDPGQVAHLVGASSGTKIACRFYSCLGHVPRLWVQSLVGTRTGGNRSMFPSHIDVSLSHPPVLSKIDF